MRLLLAALMLGFVLGVTFAPPAMSQEPGCTGENCPPPGGSGGHDCEREKKDDATA
jgi:hypothetical protein